MKIGGVDADIDWKGFGPSPDSADSLDDTEIEWEGNETVLSQLDASDPFSGSVGTIRYVASRVTLPIGSFEITDFELMIELMTAGDYVQAIIWEDSSGMPGSRLWTGSTKSGSYTPLDWYAWSLSKAVTPGVIWVGGKTYRASSGTKCDVGRKTTGGSGVGYAWTEGSWSISSSSALAYKITVSLSPFRVELVGTPGDYVAEGTFTSGVVDLGTGIALNSVKWESTEPSPTAIDTVPPPPKTVSVRASNIVPTVAEGGGAWADKDVPDVTDPEWGADVSYLVATIEVGDLPRGVACDETIGKTLVANGTSGSVSVIHTTTNTVSATIGVGASPEGIACDETIGKTLVTNSGSDSVSVIDTPSDTVSATIGVGPDPSGIDCDEVAGKTFVANRPPSASVTIISTKDSFIQEGTPDRNNGYSLYLQNHYTVLTGLTTQSFLFFPIVPGKGIKSAIFRAYCYNVGLGSIKIERITEDWVETVITWNDQPAVAGDYGTTAIPAVGWAEMDVTSLVREWDEGTYPNYGFRMSQSFSGGSAFFRSRHSGDLPELIMTYRQTVSVIDTASNTISATIEVGTTPQGVACDEIAGKTFVANSGDDAVSVINTASNSIIATISVGTSPQGIGCDETLGKTFVANYGSNNVSVIDTASNAVVATVAVGVNPRDVVCDEGVERTFITNFGNSCVTVIDTSSNLILGTISIGAGPYGIAHDETVDRVFVANSGIDKVSVLKNVPVATPYLPYTEYETDAYVSEAHRKRYAQFRAKLWSDVS